MKFQLRKLVLWPRDPGAGGPRSVDFRDGSVNVITGASKTGKSAIIPIIDYCLASDRCTIPVNTIRDSCSWFGVVVDTDRGQHLFARREPGGQKSTSDMFIAEANKVDIPEEITHKNASAEDVKRTLDERAGLTTLPFDSSDSGFSSRPSFRDMAAFMFQPQNVVANPDVLFFKADTYEHREKLRTIFPYVLGAINADILAKQQRLSRMKRTLAQKQRELAAIRTTSEGWLAEIESKLATAKELALLPEEAILPTDASGKIEILRLVANRNPDDVDLTATGIEGAATELIELEKEESHISGELTELRIRHSQMTRLREAAIRHRNAVGVKRDRLQIAKWFEHLHFEDHECPLCGHGLSDDAEEVGQLLLALSTAESESGATATVPAAFDREYERVESDVAAAVDRLQAVAVRRRAVTVSSEEAARRRYEARSRWRFLGELDEAITRFESLEPESALVEGVDAIQAEISALERDLRGHDARRRTEQALGHISVVAGRMLPGLDAERPDDVVKLSIKDLTVKISGPDREDYLWELGSGANWLSYHVAVTLALQLHFLGLPDSPVPGIIVYDQPSQVYFPHRPGARPGQNLDPTMSDEDLQAVRRVLETMANVVSSSDGRLQLIVLDHAAPSVWEGLDHVNLVEEWRHGPKLVPESW